MITNLVMIDQFNYLFTSQILIYKIFSPDQLATILFPINGAPMYLPN